MPESVSSKKSVSPDWFVRGVLTKLGDTFDRLTGRGWKPSSSLATSELIERLKALIDSEAEDNGSGGLVVPHNIRLKMQWDKFSTDSDETLRTLENELLTAAVDHINDKRYYTKAPLSLSVKPDYFTQGVKLYVSFDSSSDDEREASIDMADPSPGTAERTPGGVAEPAPVENVIARFSENGKQRETLISFSEKRRKSVGRTKGNDLAIDDASVSKSHASLAMSRDGELKVADTGSTNGTFLNGTRVPYGQARPIVDGDRVKFGTVEVSFERVAAAVPQAAEDPRKADTVSIGEFEFTQKITPPSAEQPLPTEPSIKVKTEIDVRNSTSENGGQALAELPKSDEETAN
jgi:hypothetical protein